MRALLRTIRVWLAELVPWDDVDRDIVGFVHEIKPAHRRHSGGMQP